jgi:hypothetical protein
MSGNGEPRLAWPALSFVGVHIPKTGGSTVLGALRSIFGNALQEAYADSPALSRATNPTCVYGHDVLVMFPELLERADNARWFTFLRDPLSLAVSLYFHARRALGPSGFVDRGLSHWLTHQEAYRWPNPPCHSHNHYRSWFEDGGRSFEQFEFVGISERFDESMSLLADEFGWELPAYHSRNIRPEPRPALDTDVVERFKRLNQDDYALYDAASVRLARKSAKHQAQRMRSDPR